MSDFHSFNIEHAKEYGVAEAILLWSFKFWLTKNKANCHNFHEGLYWTYNSIEAYTEMFPYLTPSKIRKALSHLEDEGVLVSGNFNKVKFDRTKWYALTEKGWGLFDESVSGNENIHFPENANGSDQNEKPIPVTNQLSKPVDKTVSRRFKPPTLQEVEEYAKEKGYDLNCEYFWDYWESIGWKRNGTTIKDWKATLRNWVKREIKTSKPKQKTKFNPLQNIEEYAEYMKDKWEEVF